MIYHMEYTVRKGNVKTKTLNARDKFSCKDYVRREGPTNVRILEEGRGYICKKCRRLMEGYSQTHICEECASQEG